ncbi:MAG: DUF5996 family protein [Gammaproteobacteria bacterium]
MNATNPSWPALPLAGWADTLATLHMWTQIVGKTRLALAPMMNHWWQVALYVSPRGLITSTIPYRERAFAVEFDFIEHSLVIRTNVGTTRKLALAPRSVADFYAEYMTALHSLGFDVRLMPIPVEVETAIPFATDRQHTAYDADAVHRCWQILLQTGRVLERFRSRFLGKASPVHFFWGSFDLAMTRFSGRAAPTHPGGAPHCPDYVMVEAYSHECSSCGFWPGGGAGAEPAFYAYTYPEPAGYAKHAAGPEGAYYSADMREFILPYEIVRNAAAPDEMLLQFFQTTYDAAADLAHWDRTALERIRETVK